MKSIKINRRNFVAGSAAATAAAVASPSVLRAQAGPIKIGEINSYTAQPAFLNPYRNGWTLALEQINAKGGALGRKIETIHRDDGGKPDGLGEPCERAGQRREGRHPGRRVPVQRRARHRRLRQPEQAAVRRLRAADRRARVGQGQPLHLPPAALDLHAGGDAGGGGGQAQDQDLGVRGAELRVRPVVREVVQGAAEEGQARRVEFVAEQFPALGKIDAGATVQALEAAKPEGIFNATFAGDLTNFVRQGNTRGLFEGREVVSMLTGEPEYLDPLGRRGAEGLDRHRLSARRDQHARAQGVL